MLYSLKYVGIVFRSFQVVFSKRVLLKILAQVFDSLLTALVKIILLGKLPLALLVLHPEKLILNPSKKLS